MDAQLLFQECTWLLGLVKSTRPDRSSGLSCLRSGLTVVEACMSSHEPAFFCAVEMVHFPFGASLDEPEREQGSICKGRTRALF